MLKHIFFLIPILFFNLSTVQAEQLILTPTVQGSANDAGPQDGIFDFIVPPPNDQQLFNNGWQQSRYAFEFDLSGIPEGVEIISANIQICIGVWNDVWLTDPQDREIELHGYSGDSILDLEDFAQNGLLDSRILQPIGVQPVDVNVSAHINQLLNVDASYASYNLREIYHEDDPNYLIMRVAEPCVDYNPPLTLAVEVANFDSDSDGISDDQDNCPLAYNPDQTNTDGDEQGNVCDNDDDGDGVTDLAPDNCPLTPNPDQADNDYDGMGNLCDLDADGDNVTDAVDACLNTQLSELANADGCSISQICPIDNVWKNHGAYVKCIVSATSSFVSEGIISVSDQGEIISQAAN